MSRPLGTLTAGRLIVVSVSLLSLSSAHTLLSSHLTKSAGTATISSPTLDVVAGGNNGDGGHTYAALYSFRVLTGGTCTIQLASLPAGSYPTITHESYTATSGWDDSRLVATNGAHSPTNGVSSFATGNAASAAGALFAATLATNNGATVSFTAGGSFAVVSSEGSSSFEQLCAIDRIVTSGTTDQGSWTFTPQDGGSYNGQAGVLAVYREITPEGVVTEKSARSLVWNGTSWVWRHALDAKVKVFV